MSTPVTDDEDDGQQADDRRVRAMNDGLRKDVKAWSAARSGGSARTTAERDIAPVTAVTATPRPRKAAPVVAAKPASTSGKPFSMSYDGVSTTEHIADLLARGAR